ncbi:ABC transporter permease [Deinococcus hopiensis]|uniref:Peptide/nickel transport system permease protein n=1 Tax=Deinococcus hopiensis KR-140 TaxID=695939 RepID=A0A1W1UVZ9_9DEIO|nr:ABC transporter permease [Deinococcus hopiensis]SMB85263.1 peptide/nickel transport system permease protein [Deinococcus hopiensis KR-140]
MIRILAHQVGSLLLGLLVASMLIFFALRVMPGDVALVIGGLQATPDQIAGIRQALGLSEPLTVQYTHWLAQVARGDFGTSLLTGTPIASELLGKVQVTLPLALLALGFGVLIGVPLGVVSGLKHRQGIGAVISSVAQLTASVPVIWSGLLLVLAFALKLPWLPAQGFPSEGWERPVRALRSLLLPALAIGLVEGAVLLRFVRSAVLEVLHEDFVRTAAAKGMTRTRALLSHGLPTVLLSVISVLGLQMAGLVVGAVVVEQLFNLPGVGRMLINDVGNRDLVKVQGELLVLTGAVLLIGVAVDTLHRLIDPRQREAA